VNIKKSIQKLLNKFDNNSPDRIRTTLKESYSLLHTLGFQPNTVIDVGVAKGTPELYSTFPDTYFLLVEPLKEFESDLKCILKKYNGSYVLAAAGPSPGQVTFNVHKNHLDGSSLYKESMGSEADGNEIKVSMVKLDDILKEKQLSGPYLIKIDAQGAELDALEGAQKALLETEVVVLEVSMFGFMKGAPQFYDVISYMKNHNFVAFDIVIGWNRPFDNALGQIDIVFVKENGMFRQSQSYSTVEQMNLVLGS
jgi:FkbM family methyltransferase